MTCCQYTYKQHICITEGGVGALQEFAQNKVFETAISMFQAMKFTNQNAAFTFDHAFCEHCHRCKMSRLCT